MLVPPTRKTVWFFRGAVACFSLAVMSAFQASGARAAQERVVDVVFAVAMLSVGIALTRIGWLRYKRFE